MGEMLKRQPRLHQLFALPRALSEECAHLGLMGLGFVVRPALLREGVLFGERVGLHSVRHPLASVEIRTAEDLLRCLPLLENQHAE